MPNSTSLPLTSKSPFREPSLLHSQGPYRHDKNSPTTTFCSHSTLSTRLHPAKIELGRTYLLDVRLVAHGSYLASLPFPKRVNVIKMIHNLQYTISRAMHFQETENSSCPMGCGMDETAMHHLGCTTLPDGCHTKIQLLQSN